MDSTKNSTANDFIKSIIARGEQMARRRHQTINVMQRGDGTWYIRPYVDIVKPDGSPGREKRVFNLDGAKNKKQAEQMAAERMALVNKPDLILVSKMTFGQLLDAYIEKHIEKSGEIGYATAKKYHSLISNHIRPFFKDFYLSDINTMMLQDWFNGKKEAGLSWATRMDIRNLMSGVFERAEAWGLWKQRNPLKGVKMGKKEAVYKHEEWSLEDTQKLIALLPADVQTLVWTGLLTGLRISEMMGLRERHLRVRKQDIVIEERWYRGNVARTKTDNSTRTIPLTPWLFAKLKDLCIGDPDRHLFHIRTRPDWGTRESTCRDDRSIRAYFLKPAAVKLGLYRKGFGFHDLRREAATSYSDRIGEAQTSKLVGHSSTIMTRHYTKQMSGVIREAQAARTDELLGVPVGPIQ